MTNNITRGWLVLFAIIIFVGGIAVGLLSGRRNARPGGPRMSFRVAQPGGPAVGNHPRRQFVRFTNALELTNEQREQWESLIAEERSRIRSLAEDGRSRFRAAQKERRAKIIEILTPEQRERFDKFTPRPQQPRRDFRRGRERRGPGRRF